MPLALIISTMEVVFWSVTPDPTYSAGYAGNTTGSMTIFLLGISIFYTGEAMHRDRELKVEPVLWTTPAPNYVFLLSKFGTTLALALSLITLVGLTAITTQLIKGHPIRGSTLPADLFSDTNSRRRFFGSRLRHAERSTP